VNVTARSAQVDSRVGLGPLQLRNPIVAASGTFGHGVEVARICDPARLGAVTAKSQAPFPWKGNAAPRLHPAACGMVNAVGLQGNGIEHWVAHDLPALRELDATVIASVWGHSTADFIRATEVLVTVEDAIAAVEVNLSCPNLDHGDTIFAHDAAATADVVRGVVATGIAVPVFAKLSAGVGDLPVIAGAALDCGATGLTLVNTVRALLVDADLRRPVLGSAGGGLSGAAIKPIALRAVHDVTRAHPGVPVIGTGGVSTGVDAVEMLLAGATAVGVGTATFADPRAPVRIVTELARWCDKRGVSRITDLVGALGGVE
jgi:dihydroorotate dehydrogenase (NAD+) catalytic subunit